MKQEQIVAIAARIIPVITEKALKASEGDVNKVTFTVPTDVTKYQMKKVVEYLYKGVKVLQLNAISVRGKVKRFKGKTGKRSDSKKMIVTLDKPIDIASEVK
jgi:large subunit ribosomal protein L23